MKVADTTFKFNETMLNKLKKIYDRIKNFNRERKLFKKFKRNSRTETVPTKEYSEHIGN